MSLTNSTMQTLSTIAILTGAFMLMRELIAIRRDIKAAKILAARQWAETCRSYAAFTHPLRRRVALPCVSFRVGSNGQVDVKC